MDEFGMNLEEVREVIDTAEVLVIRFAILEKRLLLDARHNEKEAPLLQLVPKASSVEERFRNLKQLRPHFVLPDKIMSFTWPRHVETFRAAGLWQRIIDRLAATGYPGLEEQAEVVFQELVLEEKSEVMTAIRGGDNYQSLWERKDG